MTRAAEGTFLIRLLAEHNLGRLALRSDEGVRRALREQLRLREWVCSQAGEATASGLISLLISEHLTATGTHASALPPCCLRAFFLMRGSLAWLPGDKQASHKRRQAHMLRLGSMLWSLAGNPSATTMQQVQEA